MDDHDLLSACLCLAISLSFVHAKLYAKAKINSTIKLAS